MSVPRKEATHVDAEGVEIHYYVWEAPRPRGAVHVLHGLGEHALRYEALAQRLVADGWTVWADDHRGHGRTGLVRTGGDRTRLGRLGPGGLRAAVASAYGIGRLLAASNPGLPFVMLGHSWGSFMAQMLLDAHPADFDAVVLSGTAHRTPRGMNPGDLNRRFRGPDATGYEWLSRDEEVVRAAAADPLMFAAKPLPLFGLADALRLYGRPAPGIAAIRDVPVLVIVGSEDPVGGPRSAERLVEDYRARSGFTDVTLRVIAGARHEVFNETDREATMDGVVAWLDDRVNDGSARR